jgi:hypothetical protein
MTIRALLGSVYGVSLSQPSNDQDGLALLSVTVGGALQFLVVTDPADGNKARNGVLRTGLMFVVLANFFVDALFLRRSLNVGFFLDDRRASLCRQ